MRRCLTMAVVILWTAGCARSSSLSNDTGRAIAPAGTNDDVALLTIEGAPTKGNHGAPLVVVEFADFQCPVCARHVAEIMPKLESEYVRTGKVRYVFKDFPLAQIHSRAFDAALAARCAAEQDKFWEMHHRLLSGHARLEPEALKEHASALGLDLERFRECVDSRRHLDGINDDLASGVERGVAGTPTLLVGVPLPGTAGVIRIEETLPGVSSYSNVAMVLERVLAKNAKAMNAGP